MPCGAVNPEAAFSVIPYFKTGKLISTRPLITEVTGEGREKFVSTVGTLTDPSWGQEGSLWGTLIFMELAAGTVL